MPRFRILSNQCQGRKDRCRQATLVFPCKTSLFVQTWKERKAIIRRKKSSNIVSRDFARARQRHVPHPEQPCSFLSRPASSCGVRSFHCRQLLRSSRIIKNLIHSDLKYLTKRCWHCKLDIMGEVNIPGCRLLVLQLWLSKPQEAPLASAFNPNPLGHGISTVAGTGILRYCRVCTEGHRSQRPWMDYPESALEH